MRRAAGAAVGLRLVIAGGAQDVALDGHLAAPTRSPGHHGPLLTTLAANDFVHVHLSIGGSSRTKNLS
jgi:hypothetical protein